MPLLPKERVMQKTWPCKPERNGAHVFDALSGWCSYGCGVRDDGRVVNPISGNVVDSGPRYTPNELAYLGDRAQTIVNARKAS